MKKVLITGANSYIGTSFEQYAAIHYASEIEISTIDMIDGSWREYDFGGYDCVFHVAGLAHADVGNVDEATKARYYAINTDLAIETAKKAKDDGVRQFVFMSSAIVYGDSAPYGKHKVITEDAIPEPTNFYGDSKWQADKGIRELEDENFTVTVLRPPMIYGKGSKGNYPTLAKMAKKLPVFPAVDNERSMLYIENLCEFLCCIIIRGEGGVFFPQNKEYTKTADMVKMIADASGHRISVSKTFNWPVAVACRIPGKIGELTNKAFGNLTYDQKMSEYGFDYQLYELKESIRRTEGMEEKNSRKTVWIIDHYSSEPAYGGISRQYDFAKELDKRGFNVIIFSSGFSHYTHTYISEKELFITKPFKHVRYAYVKTHGYDANNGKDRALNMVSFMTQVMKFAPRVAKRYGRPDVIEGASVHPLAWIAAYRLSRKYKVRFVAEIRDFWPQLWIDSGEKKKNAPMCVFFRNIENFTFKHADHIIYSLSHGDRYICEIKGVPRSKTTLIGQPMDCERYDVNRERREELPEAIREFIKDGFICTFTGYFMDYEGVMVMLEAQKILQERGIELKMLFAGSGEAEADMKEYCKREKLKNVLISERISKELVPPLLYNSDVCMAHMEYPGKETVFRYGISKNKINDYLYSGSCTVFGFRYDDNEVVESGGGVQYRPFDAEDLADKLEALYKAGKENAVSYGNRAREYMRKNHDVRVLADKLVNALLGDSAE